MAALLNTIGRYLYRTIGEGVSLIAGDLPETAVWSCHPQREERIREGGHVSRGRHSAARWGVSGSESSEGQQ